MEDTFPVESLAIANSPRTQSSKLTSDKIIPATPPRIPQITPIKGKFVEVTANNLTVSPVTVIESTTKITSFYDSILHIAPNKHRNTTIPPLATGKIAVRKPTLAIDSINPDGFETDTVENSPSEIDSYKFDSIQTNILQNNAPKISFASNISSEQFFSIHQTINNLNNKVLDVGFRSSTQPTRLRSYCSYCLI